MKKILIALTLTLAVVTTYGQGRVNFSNGSTTAITTNNLAGTSGSISGAGNYYFGLYLGAAGTPEASLQLALLATNTALAGRLTGGNPANLSAPWADGVTTPYPLAFQIRGWSAAGGLTYEAAYAAAIGGNSAIYTGLSGLGSVTPTFVPTVAGALFGTSAGNVGGFVLSPQVIVPEPSSIALGLLGLGAIALFRRRK